VRATFTDEDEYGREQRRLQEKSASVGHDSEAQQIRHLLSSYLWRIEQANPAPQCGVSVYRTITGEERKIDVRFFPLGSVDFLIPPQKEINAKFVSPTQIELENWGQIYIRDEFYEKICAIVSKAEGKPIDILKNNR